MTRDQVAALLKNQADAKARALRSLAMGDPGPLFDTPELLGTIREPGVAMDRETSVWVADWRPRPLEVRLPLPPSWNRAFRAAAMPTKQRHKRGPFRGERVWTARVYKSKEAEAYAGAAGSALRRQGIEEPPFPRNVMLRISGDVVMARAGCDLDDRFKVLLDALQGLVFENDEQVAAFGDVRRLVDSSDPHVRLTFEPIPVDRYGKATR